MPGGNQQVLGDPGAVGDRAVVDAGLEPEPVDLDGLAAVAGHVEQARLDAGRGDPDPGPLRDQGGQRDAERSGDGVERAQRRVADPVLDLRQRPLAHAGRLRERADGQAALAPRRAQPLADQTGQVIHEHRV
jgi:hypothetical protein